MTPACGGSVGDSLYAWGVQFSDGANILDGGSGSDLLRYRLGRRRERGFPDRAGGDITRLVGLDIDSFVEVQAALSQPGSDVVLDLGNGNSITYADTAVAGFQAGNFAFA